jgi:hypothetical protein
LRGELASILIRLILCECWDGGKGEAGMSRYGDGISPLEGRDLDNDSESRFSDDSMGVKKLELDLERGLSGRETTSTT